MITITRFIREQQFDYAVGGFVPANLGGVTFVIGLDHDNKTLSVKFSVCSQKDNFQRSFGTYWANKSEDVITMPYNQEEIANWLKNEHGFNVDPSEIRLTDVIAFNLKNGNFTSTKNSDKRVSVLIKELRKIDNRTFANYQAVVITGGDILEVLENTYNSTDETESKCGGNCGSCQCHG